MAKYVYKYKDFLILIAIPIILSIFYYIGKSNDDQFYKVKINSIIISRSTWREIAVGFYMDNGLRIDSSALNEINIQIGDSIAKDAKSWNFKVFKKNIIGGYEYYETYSLKIRK